MLVESFFARFWAFEFLSQTDHFAKSIPFARWPIFKMVSFLEYLVFFLAVFFPQNNSNVLLESFLAIWIFEPNWPFCKVYSLSKMADFQSGLLSRIYRVFSSSFFSQNNSNVLAESFFLRFWPFEFLTQTDHFAKSIAFPRWPIFKMVSFLEYLVFFQGVFCTDQL